MPSLALRQHVGSALLLAASLAITGCHADPNEEAAQCPKPYLLPDADTLVRYRGSDPDLSDLILKVKLTDVQGACSGKIGTKLEGAHAHVVMVATRGPAATSAEVDIPYGVGVMHAGEILGEEHYVQHVVFPPNVDAVEVSGQEVKFSLPTSKSVSGPSYHIYFWLQLTPEELAANRHRAHG
jgi:hypothetical protein